ncbi:hypothetical protein [Paenibacillus sp. GCM10023250]|uniref:hypothetical protein n=1 Tax=Paenibacillus sp. GCM10023250 TaxID=3252648 RepID=UPI0036217EAD
MIEVRRLTKSFGSLDVLRGIDLTLGKGKRGGGLDRAARVEEGPPEQWFERMRRFLSLLMERDG